MGEEVEGAETVVANGVIVVVDTVGKCDREE
jgi:hypothetical protein